MKELRPAVYPGTRYHPTLGSRVVHSEEEALALGEGWKRKPYPAPPPPPPPLSEIEQLRKEKAAIGTANEELGAIAEGLRKEVARLKSELAAAKDLLKRKLSPPLKAHSEVTPKPTPAEQKAE